MPRRLLIDSLQASISRLNLDEKQQLYNWLGQQLQEQSLTGIDISQGKIGTRNYGGRTYVAQKRRCGKLACSCMDGEILEVGHGPYWYAYWNEDGKTRNSYVGKRAPWQKDQLEKDVEKKSS